MLEIAERAIGLAVVPEARPARRDGIRDDGADRLLKPFQPGRRPPVRADKGPRAPARRQAGPVQRLADINVAEAGDPLLIEKRGLQRRTLAAKEPRQMRGERGVADGFRPERPHRLSPRVGLRPEPFGALAYHFDNRRLVFLKSPELVALVRATDRLPGAIAPHTVLAKVLLDSGQVGLPLLVDIQDAPRWLTDRFLLHLGRRPAPEELQAYGRVLLDPDGGVELVVLALVTNAEYACR